MKFLAENIMLSTTVGMNINPLKRSVNTAQVQLKSMNTALKAQSRAFKDAGMDANQLAEREKMLGRAIKNQEEVIEGKKVALQRATSAVKDHNNASQKEIQAVERARGALAKQEYALKGLQNEMTRTKNAQKMMTGEIAGLKAEYQQLDAATSRAVGKFKQMNNASGALRAEYKGLSAQVNKHGQVLDKEQANLKQTEYALGRSSDEYKQQSQVVAEATKKQKALEAQQARVKTAIDKGRTSVGRSTEQMKQMGDRYKSVGNSMRSVGQGMVAGITLPVSLGLGMAIKKSMDFEGQMSKVGAVSGATAKEMRAMKDQAIDLGAKTSLSATEVADGMTELAKKGFTANQTMKAMPGVISAAEASGSSMAETSNVMASAIQGFGLEAGKSGHVADVLAEAANKSSADVGDLGQTFKYVAPIAKTLGMSLEDTSAAAMVMSNSGIDASQAGTSMRMSLLRMAKPTAKGKAEMDKLGVSLTDAEGNFVGLPKLIGQYQKGLQGMTKEQKLATISNVVGTEASSAFLTLIDAGPKKLDKYSTSLKNSDGASAEAAKKMKDNLKGAVEQLGGAFESLGLIIGESLTPFLKALAGAVTWVVDKLAGMPKWVITTITVMALLAAAIGPVLVGIGALVASIGAIMGSTTIMAILGGIGSAIAGISAPIWIAIGAIAALGAAFVIAYKKSETFRNIIKGALHGIVVGFQAMWNGIKTIGGMIGSFIMNNIIGPIASFGAKIMAQVMSFWNQNGPMIMQALQNIWSVAQPILMALFNLFKTVFNGILGIVVSVLKGLWMVVSPILTAFATSFMAVWNFIKLSFAAIWGALKGIVQGSLNVILGIVKVFGGVFTGNWSAVWSGLGQIVKGLLGIILAPIKLLFTMIRNVFGLFGTILKAIWNGLWGALKGIVLGIVGVIVAIVKAGFNGMKAFLTYLWTSIKAGATIGWNAIKAVIINPIKAVIAWFRTSLPALKAFFSVIWNGIKNTTLTIVRVLSTGIRAVFGVISKFTRIIFNGVKGFLIMVWTVIKNRVVGLARGLWNIMRGIWNVLSKVSRSIFNGLRNFFVMIWTSIKNRVVGQARALWSIVRGVWNTLSRVSRSIFNSVRNFIVAVWTNLRNRVVAFTRSLWNIVRSIWNTLSKVSRSIFSNVRNFIVSVWTNLRNRVVAFSRSLWNIVRGVWNTLSKVSRSIFSNVRNFIISVWTNLRNRVVAFTRSLWNIVRGIWNTLSRVTRNIFNSVRNFLVGIWTKIRDKVAGFARSLWSKVSGSWNSLSSGTKKVFNAVRNYLVDKWEGIKTKVTDIVSGLWGSVKDTFTNMKDGIKGLAGKIGDTIEGMVKGIKKGLNALIKGVNWVAKKLGIDEKIPELSTGTGGVSHAPTGVGAGVSNGVVSSPGFATVNDRGRGNGSGSGGHQELIQKANGQVFAPKGRDVTVPLGKGDRVINGRDTQRLQKSGAIPKFSKGIGSGVVSEKMLKDLKKKKKKKDDEEHGAMDAIGTRFGVAGGGKSWQEKLAGGLGTAAGKTVKAKKKVEAGAKAGAKVAGDKIGELLDYVGKPGKLLDAVLGKFGVKFPKIKGQITKDMMWDPMWKQLKNGTRTLFDGWLTESEGAGDGGYVDLSKGINFGFAPTAAAAAAQGYPFPRPHMGLDINYKYGEKLYSTLAGKGTGKSGYNGGFGNSMWLKSGNLEAIYGHMSKLAWNGTKSVKPGSYLGRVGSTGDSTGPHLHYEMRRNGKPFDPTKWLKSNNGGGKGGGKYGKQIKQALGMAGLPQTAKYIKAWQEQARTESTFNPKARNPSGASGLVQVKPATFGQYKLPGHGNIWNPLDNLIAGMRYAKARYGAKGMLNQIGHGLPYAKGTNNATPGLHPVFEKGGEIMNLRGGEQIIPNDVSITALKQMMSSDIFAKTQSAVYAGISQYADALRQQQTETRAKELQARQQANASSNEIAELKSMVADMVYLMQAQLSTQENIAGTNQQIANKDLNLDGKKVTKDVSEQEAFNLLMRNYNSGITR